MIDLAIFMSYAEQCAPQVHPRTMSYLVRRESSFNPFAIAVVGGIIARQPRNLPEAVATARWLTDNNINFSAGISQINVKNFTSKGLDVVSVFDVCKNLRAGSEILADCHERAVRTEGAGGQAAIEMAMSCYYSNNFTTGLKHGYVQAIAADAYKSRR